MTKPAGSEGRVNAAFVHGKFTFLSGEVCVSCNRRFMREIRNRSNRLNNDPAYPSAVDGYESLWETQSRQQLITNPVAPDMETYPARTQKSAEGIVIVGAGFPCPESEGLNTERREAIS
ncbi:MAG: hypothetical protein WC594_01705 [Thermodesulfovibrionales bacterium]